MSIINDRCKSYTLDNGFSIILLHTETKTVAGKLEVNLGALHENEGEEGLVHFLEHVIGESSKKYTKNKAKQTIEQFGYYNQSTSFDKTKFPVRMFSEDTALYLDFISDSLFSPLLDSTIIENECQRILREISDQKSTSSFEDFQLLREAVYGKDSQYNYEICGKESVVSAATKKDLKAIHQRGYYVNNMNLLLVGGIPDDIEKHIERFFGRMKKKRRKKKILFKGNIPLTKQTIIHKSAPDLYNKQNPLESNTKLFLKMYAPPKDSNDYFAFIMLNRVLGGKNNSRLFEEVSHNRGLAYRISSNYNTHNNRGVFSINGSIHATRIEESLDAIFGEINKLQNEDVDYNELERIKRKKQFDVAELLESNTGLLGLIELDKEGRDYEGIISGINNVDTKDLLDVANKYLPKSRDDENYALLLRDPLKK